MAKTLKQVIEIYKPKAGDEQKFVDKHVIASKEDPNGNGDEVFKGTKVKVLDRKKERHGYDVGADDKVYEEKTPKWNPIKHIPKEKQNDAIKTAAKDVKRGSYADRAALLRAGGVKEETVVEETEQIDELSKTTLGNYVKSAARNAVAARKIGADFEHRGKRAKSSGMKAANDEISQKYKEKSWKRRDGIEKAVNRLTKEEVELVTEGDESHARFQHYHNESAKLLKGIHSGLSKHYDNVTNKKGYNNGEAHWGHVGDIKDIHSSLQDLHDRILQTGEYARPPKLVKEEVEVQEDTNTSLLNLYANLDDDNRISMVKMIDEGRKDELLEFAAEVGTE